MSSEKKLTLSDDKLICGVCGGIAEYFNWDPTWVRVIYALLTIFTAFCGVIVYIVMYAIVPSKRKLGLDK